MRDTHIERQRHRQREKQAPCREPDARLDPGTPGSCPGAKAGAQPLNHLGVPESSLNAKPHQAQKAISLLLSPSPISCY